MEYIAKAEVGPGGSVGMVFNVIPNTFTDLYLVTSHRHEANVIDGQILVNGSGGSRRALYSQPTTASSVPPAAVTSGIIGIFGSIGSRTADTFATNTVYFYDYNAAKTHSVTARSVETNYGYAAFQGLVTSITSSSAAITSIEIRSTNGNLAEGSYAVLYGILKGSDGVTTVS